MGDPLPRAVRPPRPVPARHRASPSVSILLSTEKALRRGGDVIQIAALRIKDQDDRADDKLTAHRKTVEAADHRAAHPVPPTPHGGTGHVYAI